MVAVSVVVGLDYNSQPFSGLPPRSIGRLRTIIDHAPQVGDAVLFAVGRFGLNPILPIHSARSASVPKAVDNKWTCPEIAGEARF